MQKQLQDLRAAMEGLVKAQVEEKTASMSIATPVVAGDQPAPVESSHAEVRGFCEISTVKTHGATAAELRAYIMLFVTALPTELRGLVGDTAFQIVSMPPRYDRR